MFIKELIISSEGQIIRRIPFKSGINLIVDESKEQITGNNVGKTTVLKLVDFCLGGSPRGIYIDPETKKNEYTLVKEFLVQNKVLVTLILVDDLISAKPKQVVIERNFLSRNDIIRRVNGKNYTADEFEVFLGQNLFNGHNQGKPTFRQIISHNIRYSDESLNNTLRTLDKFTSDAEYETLYLYLFGCDFTKGDTKQGILNQIKQETLYKSRLEKQQTKTAYEVALALVNREIEVLQTQKQRLNINPEFSNDLNHLNELKYQINRNSSELSRLVIRRDLINESAREIEDGISDIDVKQIRIIYQQASNYVEKIQKTFEELVSFHNKMIFEKISFIKKELPALEGRISELQSVLERLLETENKYSKKVSKSDSFLELEDLIIRLNENFKKRGEYETIIRQIETVDANIQELNQQLFDIDQGLFSNEFEGLVKAQINKFNEYFAMVSRDLYGEQYAIKYDKVTNKKGQRLYKFSSFNTNISSGKKQGEISCFDIAYTLFADGENIPCLHFLLNDKKELMHDNQLIKIADLVKEKNIQFVMSILKDKLPNQLNKPEFFSVVLSQKDKLFRIENLK